MTTRDLVLIALFAAIVAALGVFPPITIPAIGVPITAQSLGVMLAGGVLGARRGAMAIVLFLVLVAIGLPLLSGGRGGMGVFAGPTAGYLVGYVVGAFVVGFLVERLWSRLTYAMAFLACFIGAVVVLYAIGVPWSAFVAEVSMETAMGWSLIYIPGDTIKCIIAAIVIVLVKKTYPIIRPS